MRIIYTGLILLFLLSNTYAQLSENWEGEWAGELKIYNEKGLQQTVDMGLNIISKSDSLWSWQIIYGSGEQEQLRDYLLYKNKADLNQYILDEQNSIQLYLSHVNQGLYSWFTVTQNELLVSYELIDEEIHFKTIVTTESQSLITGGESNSPEVKSQKIRTIQEAILIRKQ
ncbi:hypothetical protein [Roseivirga echinicomitans]|uniref:Uncharacterized protein n=1 Tax=Roseivirga echinicomitans TaxID=296218 RepID=A0A150XNC0_9BACT|nr:hypothetical protein [Roseivirga echinicomitans]KYG80239.1 hypothetical protein AWN68_17200 [Roseivirga echinicomitans]